MHPYVSLGRMIVVYIHFSLLGVSPQVLPMARFTAKMVFMHLSTALFMWGFQDSLLSSVIPRYFTEVERGIYCDLIRIVSGWFILGSLLHSKLQSSLDLPGFLGEAENAR